MRIAIRAAPLPAAAITSVSVAAPAFAGQADGPGAVGAFESTLSQSSRPVLVCLP